ncbi:MAG: hypothetical protein O7E52_15390, partial [Candidatus Poribacteria bacterium]|nr:hypothetical protein [Candidatus Poribacteria bacterium]
AAEMFIDGNVEDTDSTREFIPFASPIEVVLSRGDGLKTVTVQLRDAAEVALETVSASITLDQTPPAIVSVSSREVSEPDERGRYHAGERVILTTTAAQSERGLESIFRIRSAATDYDSGEQSGQDNGNGTYTFSWDTVGLGEADDYRLEAVLSDNAGHTASDNSTVISIDNTPPQDASFEVHALNPSAEIPGADEDSPARVKTRSIQITYSVADATALFVAGDLVIDSNTLVWIPVDQMPTWIGNLSPGDGPKSVRVRFRDVALNETEFVSETLILDEQPAQIASVLLFDEGENRRIEDSDDVFFIRAGQDVTVEVATEPEVVVFVRVQSEAQGIDTGEQEALPVEGRDGIFQFLWETRGLNDSDDYSLTATVQDRFDRRTEQNLSITLDTVSPENPTVQIDRGNAFTVTDRVPLDLSADGATEMFIGGDVVADSLTFQWIALRKRIEVNLTPDDGEKEVRVRFRDEARNETAIVSAFITLDAAGPEAIAIRVKGQTDFTSTRDITLELEAERVTEMLIDGSIIRDALLDDWLPFASEFPVKLTTPDGTKQIGVRFRSAEGNETARIQTTIVLDREPPEILEILSSDVQDPSDDDGIYSPGQQIRVSARSEPGLSCTLRITGRGFNSGEQEISENPAGVYSFLWNTGNLAAGTYVARWECTDDADNQVSDEIEIVLDDTIPTDGQIEITVENRGGTNADPTAPGVIESPTVTLLLQARDAEEMFVSGDVVDDTNTFQWISFRESLVVNLAGPDGEKTVSVRFRSTARNESQSTDAKITMDTSRPRLLGIINLLEDADREGGIIVLSFDEDIFEIVPDQFHLDLSNPFRSGDVVRFDGVNVPAEINFGKVILTLSAEQLRSVLDLQGSNPTQSVIRGSLAEDSARDSVQKNNPPATDVPVQIQRLARLAQTSFQNTAFSPNGDGSQDTLQMAYTLSAGGFVTIEILDGDRVVVATLRNEFQPAGFTDNVVWDGRDQDDKSVPEGLYQFRISIFDTGLGLPIGLENEDIILDNQSPEIVEVFPQDGQTIIGTTQFRVITQDGGSVPSGVADVILEVAGQRIPLVSSEPGIHELPPGTQLNLPEGQQQVTFSVSDGAGTETRQTLNYLVAFSAPLSFINYPNPVRSGQELNLRYVLEGNASEGNIRIFDAEGGLVFFKELAGTELNAGTHPDIRWNGQDLFGNPLPRGVYFALLQVEVGGDTQKVKHKIAVR